MKSTISLILLLLIVSCSNNKGDYYSKNDIVDITEISIPDTLRNEEFATITAKAEAKGDCWEQLYFKLTKYSEFEYSIRAYGYMDSDGLCPAKDISEDTVIQFTPAKKGQYIFYVTRKVLEIEADTMIVE